MRTGKQIMLSLILLSGGMRLFAQPTIIAKDIIAQGPTRDPRGIYGASCNLSVDSVPGIKAALVASKADGRPVKIPCLMALHSQLDLEGADIGNGWVLEGADSTHDPNAPYIGLCGIGGTAVPMVVVNRTQNDHLQGLQIWQTCPGFTSSFTKGVKTTNDSFKGGFPTTNIEFDHLQIYGNGFYIPPGASQGSQVMFLEGAVGPFNPAADRFADATGSTTLAVNGTTYRVTADVAWRLDEPGTGPAASVAIAANGVVVASQACSPTHGAYQTGCTVAYTADAGHAGQTISVEFKNAAAAKAQAWFDNVTVSNITGLTNLNMELPNVGGPGGFSCSATGWTFTGPGCSGVVNPGIVIPPFVALQFGDALCYLQACGANLEKMKLKSLTLKGNGQVGSYGIEGDGPCCMEGYEIENVDASNFSDTIYGVFGGQIKNLYNSDNSAGYSLYGAGHAIVNLLGCAASKIEIDNIESEGVAVGPLLASTGCGSVKVKDTLISGGNDIAPGEFLFRIEDGTLTFDNIASELKVGTDGYIVGAKNGGTPGVIVNSVGYPGGSLGDFFRFISPTIANLDHKDATIHIVRQQAVAGNGDNPLVGQYSAVDANGLIRPLFGINKDSSLLGQIASTCAVDASLCLDLGSVEITSIPYMFPAVTYVGTSHVTSNLNRFGLVGIDASANENRPGGGAYYNDLNTWSGGNSITLTWPSATLAGAASYRVLWYDNAGSTWRTLTTVTDAGACSGTPRVCSYSVAAQPTNALTAYTQKAYNQTAVIKFRGNLQFLNGNGAKLVQHAGTITTTAAATDTLAVSGATHCSAQATNSTAAGLTGVFVGVSAGVVTLNHSASASGTFDIFCSFN